MAHTAPGETAQPFFNSYNGRVEGTAINEAMFHAKHHNDDGDAGTASERKRRRACLGLLGLAVRC